MHAKRMTWVLTLTLIASLLLVACGGGGSAPAADSGGDEAASSDSADAGGEAVTIKYSLWDPFQLPVYEQCADDFMAANPNITVEISQLGWGDYWSDIQTGMVAGTAPDVFTNHLAKYPEFATKNQLVDIQPFVDADSVDTGMYIGELAELWTRDGQRFGLPKDWDTISVVYNKEMLDAAGVTVEEINDTTWNAQDGGSFEEIVAKLTLDENGNNGLSPDFDSENVETYGLVVSAADAGGYGQTQYSHFAVSNGWKFLDGLYGTEYYYGDPAFIETIDWLAKLSLEKGYSMPYEESSSLGAQTAFDSGAAALITDGSWTIKQHVDNSDFEVGFARLPAGPEGRKSMFNGLADSIWTGSEHPEEAWAWVKYAASPACEDVVGASGLVFPAIESGVTNALAAFEEKGLDVSSFTDQALEEGGTFLFPVADNAAEITSIMQETMDAIFLGQAEAADILPESNAEVNALFE